MAESVGQPPQDVVVRDIYVVRGDTFSKEVISFTDTNDQPIDVSSWTIEIGVFAHSDGSEVLRATEAAGEVLKRNTNEVVLSLSETQTDGLTEPRYIYEIRVERTGYDPWYPQVGELIVYDRLMSSL